MTYKQIETSREIRQWFKLISAMVGGAIYIDWRYPELKEKIADKVKTVFRKEQKWHTNNLKTWSITR